MEEKRLYGAIDIGTNTVRLLVASKDGTPAAEKFVITTRLGGGLADTGLLNDAAMQRTLDTVSEFIDITIRKFNCILPVFCYATSAVRQAANGRQFINRLNEIKEIKCEILSEEQEAICAFIGAGAGTDPVMDIGGGSTELITKKGKKIVNKSVTLGCVTAFEKFIDSDPPSIQNLSKLDAYCSEKAKQLVSSVLKQKIRRLVCVGGTATQMAMLKLGLPEYSSEKVNGYAMSRTEVQQLYKKLSLLTDNARKRITGMEPTRSDIIITGCAIALAMMEASGAQVLVASDYDGLNGYLKLRINYT